MKKLLSLSTLLLTFSLCYSQETSFVLQADSVNTIKEAKAKIKKVFTANDPRNEMEKFMKITKEDQKKVFEFEENNDKENRKEIINCRDYLNSVSKTNYYYCELLALYTADPASDRQPSFERFTQIRKLVRKDLSEIPALSEQQEWFYLSEIFGINPEEFYIRQADTVDRIDSNLRQKLHEGEIEITDLPKMMIQFIDFLSKIAAGVSVLVLVIGGLKYMLSGLSEDKTSAKSIIMWALVGLGLSFSAWIIVKIIVSQFIGTGESFM